MSRIKKDWAASEETGDSLGAQARPWARLVSASRAAFLSLFSSGTVGFFSWTLHFCILSAWLTEHVLMGWLMNNLLSNLAPQSSRVCPCCHLQTTLISSFPSRQASQSLEGYTAEGRLSPPHGEEY